MWCQVQATAAITGQGCPLVRSKHAMCSTNDGRIYLYGGKSLLNQTLRDLWQFDIDENQWIQMNHIGRNNELCNNKSNQMCQTCRSSTNEWQNNNENHQSESSWNDAPPPLQEHTIIGYKNKLYVFGGEIGYSSDETPLWIFDLEKFIWRKFTPNSNVHTMNAISRPLGRRAHSAVVYQNIMCIYGGYQDIKGSTSEIWTFNLDTEEWYLEGNNPKKDTCPLARHGHSAVVHKDSMYVYGGMSNLNVRGDFWAWNFKSKEWNRVKTNRNPGVLSFHSAIVVLDSMFIYGGERSNGNHTNELWRYRFANQTWEHIEVKGIAPSCRTRHVAVANPFLKQLESKTHNNVEWKTRNNSCKQQNNNNLNNKNTENKKTKRHRNHHGKKKQMDETHFAKSTETDNLKSISMCFNRSNATSKSPSIFSLNESKSKVEESKTILNDSKNVSTQKENGYSILNRENNQNILNNLNNEDNTIWIQSSVVRMRPRRPLLQKQRPYSDFYGEAITQNKDSFDFNELNEIQFKRRSVQESMSYYSLCFSTPPAHLRQKSSPSDVLLSPTIGPMDSIIAATSSPKELLFETESKKLTDNVTYFNDCNESVSTISANQFNLSSVKRRENFISKRRLRKADLELLDFTSLAIPNTNPSQKDGYSHLYSLTLDISPDFEKELKFSTNSTPSNDLNSIHSVSTTDHYDYESIEMTHLDMLEDYLEPEEMLEIVTESASGEEISSSLNIKTIPRTPARRMKTPDKIHNNDRNNQNGKNEGNKKMIHQLSGASVSNSSSGYQSLILTDSNVNSFEITSNPSISNSSSFGDQQNEKKDNDFDHLSVQKLVSKLSDSFKNEQIELKQMNSLINDSSSFHNKNEIRTISKENNNNNNNSNNNKTRSSHFQRLSHWEPNIKEVIEEVAIPPGSPVIQNSLPDNGDNDGNSNDNDDNDNVHDDDNEADSDVDDSGAQDVFNELSLSLIDDSFIYKDQSVNNNTKINEQQRHPIFCMYVFGGKEDCITGVLNKQSMTIWKYYT